MVRLILFAVIGAIIGMVGLNVLRQFVGDGPVALVWIIIMVVVIVVVFRNLGTNRRVPDAAPDVRSNALAFTPDAGKASLYILRTQFVGKAVGINIEIDGNIVAQLKSPRFTRILLTPGAHRLSGYTGPAKGRKPGGELDLNVTAGEIVPVMVEVVPGMVGTISKFTRVELSAIRQKLASTRMVQPDVAEV